MNDQQPEGFQDDDISALADGALAGADFTRALDRLATDDEALGRWHAYHVVGDVLRSTELAACTGDLDFVARFQQRLAQEPALQPLPEVQPTVPPVIAVRRQEAANAGVFRWKAVAGLASLAAVAAIGWQSWQVAAPGSAPAGGAVMASTVPETSGLQQVRADMPLELPAERDATSVAASDTDAQATPVMLRNAQLDELLAAHGRAVGGAALQSQGRLLRTVSITEDSSR